MKLAVVGIFYDGYEDLWYDFLNLFAKNWADCPYELYIVNNIKELDVDKYDADKVKVTVLHAGADAEYSRKVQVAVNDIDADYYLLLLEDFFVARKVDNERMETTMRFVVENDVEYYTMPMPEFCDKKEKRRYKGSKEVFQITEKKEYLMSCQPSLWKKDFLRLCIGEENYNAWIFEGIYATMPCVRNCSFLERCVVDYRNVLNLRHGALQGKMLPRTVKILKKEGYTLTTPRTQLSFKKNFLRVMRRGILKVLSVLHLDKMLKRMFQKGVLDRYGKDIQIYGNKVITEEKIADFIQKRNIL